MKAVLVAGLPKLHVTPLPMVILDCNKVIVEADNDQGSCVRLVFEPYQAVKVTTADCFEVPGGVSIIPQTTVEIKNSTWIESLRNTLKKTDCDAIFMDKAKHFLLPLQDDFLEVVAWDVRSEPTHPATLGNA